VRRDISKCGGVAGICRSFYDTAPSGRYGTMIFMGIATVNLVKQPLQESGEIECSLQ